MVDDKEKQIQELYLQFQLIVQQIQELEKQCTQIAEKISELKLLKNNVAALKFFSKEDGAFAQLGAGIFVKSKLAETSTVLVEVGSKVFVEKSPDEAEAIVEEQARQMEQYLEGSTEHLSHLNRQAKALQAQLKNAIA